MKNINYKQKLCQPIVIGGFFSAFDFKKVTKITLFEKFCLWFVKAKYQIDEVENYTLIYKIFRGKMYVLGHWINQPKQWNCRCSVVSSVTLRD